MTSRILAAKPSDTEVKETGKNSALSAAFVGLVAAAICFGWFYFNTHYLYKGNWTSIYYRIRLYGFAQAAPAASTCRRYAQGDLPRP